jgi:hypothetical protein
VSPGRLTLRLSLKPLCSCGKLCFNTRQQAKQVGRRKERLHGKRFKVYRCPRCDKWHLATKYVKEPRDVYELIVWTMNGILSGA